MPTDAGDYLRDLECSADTSRRRMVQSRELIRIQELAALLNESVETVSRKIRCGRIASVLVDEQAFCPAFYSDQAVSEHLEQVTFAMGKIPNWEKIRFFVTRKASLSDATPLEALRAGLLRKVIQAAKAFSER